MYIQTKKKHSPIGNQSPRVSQIVWLQDPMEMVTNVVRELSHNIGHAKMALARETHAVLRKNYKELNLAVTST